LGCGFATANRQGVSIANSAALADYQLRIGSIFKATSAFGHKCAVIAVNFMDITSTASSRMKNTLRILTSICENAGAANYHPGYVA
jgi:hypothetical protein